MSEMLTLETYLRRFSLFRSNHLDMPVVYPIARLQLPKLSILHFAAIDGVTIGPQISDPMLRQVPGIVYVDHQIQYHDPIGNPTKAFFNPNAAITEFRRRQRAIRPLKSLERLEIDTRSLVVYNYSMLAMVAKYPVSFRSGYFLWYNVFKEVIQNTSSLVGQTQRQHFIEIDLPEVMPTLTQLRSYNARVASDTLKYIRTPEAKFVADLFQWAGENRYSSLLSKLGDGNYDKVNLIVRRLNGFVVVNLGWLDRLRKNEKMGREKGLDPKMFDLKVLRLLNLIHQATSPIASDIKDQIVQEPVVEVDPVDEAIDTPPHEDDEVVVTEELHDEKAEINKLEKELEELDRIREVSKGTDVELVDDVTGDILDVKTIDIDILSTIGETPKEGEAMIAKADEMSTRGLLTPAEHRRLLRISEAYKELPDPYGSGERLEDAMVITEDDIKISPVKLTNDAVVTDKSLTESRVDAVERQYIEKVLKKDILRCVTAIQRAPVAVTGYAIDRVIDAVNDQEIHSIKIAPAVGVPSTVKFPIPTIHADGTMLYNGTKYRMRKQRSDLPIRKVAPDRVSLSSYYSKVFVERSSRKTFSYGKRVIDTLVVKCLDPEDPYVSKAVISNAFDAKADVPLIYSTVAQRITQFQVGNLELFFDYGRRHRKYDYTEAEAKFEKKGWVLIGRNDKGSALVMDPLSMIYEIVPDAQGGSLEEVGTIEQLAGIDVTGFPTYMAEMKIYSKVIPVGVALAYLLGLDGLLETLRLKPRRVLVGERLNLQSDEYAVRFKNESLIFKRTDVMSSMLMSGFNLYHSAISNFDIGLFNEKDVYSAVLDRAGVGGRYLRELDTMNMLFIDPITEDLLKWMKEPTTYTGLLVRSVEMLVVDTVETRRKDRDQIVEGMERVRGYERVAGVIYEHLARAVRTYNAKAASGRAQVLVNPNEPINAIIQDPTCAPVNNLNPIHSLREREVITYGGRGGRSRRAMVARTRLFTEEDMGFISEGTVDSGDVAIITYLSPNSNITTTRGTIRLYDPKRDGAGSIMSTAALLSFSADCDDPKRVNFITVQHGHGIQADGYEVQGVRTGMERVIASRMTPEFASTAKGPGEVTDLTADSIAVTYKDGSVDKIPLGLVQTTAEGTNYPNTLVTGLQVGDKVDTHDVITYNKGFFKPSPFDPKRVDYMSGCVARIALREATYTVEDSSSISVAFAERMMTQVSKLKTVQVNFREGVQGLVEVGDIVDLDTILCTIEGQVSSDVGLFDESTRETLKNWAAASPRAKAVGVVSQIEVYYNGDVEDMSDSLQQIVAASEKNRRRQAKRLGKEYVTGSVTRNVRIDGHTVEADQAIIMVYTTTRVPMGIADKLVVGNQGKSTVGEILFGNNRTLETQEPIDIIFGAKSFVDRIIMGPFNAGTTNTVLRYIGEDAYLDYFGEEA